MDCQAPKGERYPTDPPTVEEIIEVMRTAGRTPDGRRLRALIVVLWRAGLRISEALALEESDLDPGRGTILIRHGNGGEGREVGMDRWAWSHLDPWLETRHELPVGAFLCVIHGATPGRHWKRPPHASNSIRQQPSPGFGAGLHRIGSDTLTPWKWRTKAYRSS